MTSLRALLADLYAAGRLVECRLEADRHDERFGVWAGVDREVRRQRRTRRAAS